MKRQSRNHYRSSTEQDIERSGAKRTTRRIERAQLKRSTQAELKDWRKAQHSS